MCTAIVFAACGAASYLLGAVPFGYIIARTRGVDIRRVGSHNIGATNVLRCVGKKWGILAFVCDMLKGFIPAFVLPLLVRNICPDNSVQGLNVACGFLAVIGHNWPVYLHFKGGKGVATSAGALLGIAPAAMCIGLISWIIVLAATRYVSVASMTAAVILSISAWFLYPEPGKLVPIALTVLALLAILRHKGNIERLIKGKENRFRFGKK